MKTKDEMLSY